VIALYMHRQIPLLWYSKHVYNAFRAFKPNSPFTTLPLLDNNHRHINLLTYKHIQTHAVVKAITPYILKEKKGKDL
jgi:hypothetical protein